MTIFKTIFICIFFTLASCKSNMITLLSNEVNNQHPLKVWVTGIKPDKARVFVLIPQKVKFIPNYPEHRKIVHSAISLSGGSAYNVRKHRLSKYIEEKDSLSYSPSDINLENGKEYTFNLYAGYLTVIKDSLMMSKFVESNFVQMDNGMKIYNIGKISEYRSYINTLVPDSLKGFIHFKVRTLSDDPEFFHENVPVKF